MDDMHLKYFRNELVKWESHLSSNPGCFMVQCIRITSNMPNLTVVQWWRWLFILRTVGLMVKLYIFLMAGWVRFGFSCYCPWNQHTWHLKNWWTNNYTFSLPFFWWEITHPKICSCEAKRSSKNSPTHCGRPKKDSLSSFCTRKLRCNVEFLSFPTCHRSSLSLGKSAWQGDM